MGIYITAGEGNKAQKRNLNYFSERLPEVKQEVKTNKFGGHCKLTMAEVSVV